MPGTQTQRVQPDNDSPSAPPITRHRIEIKVSEAQKDLITRAAARRGKGLSEFVRTAAEAAARDVLGRE